MILDALELEDDTTLQADVCIAGAGAAGITLAMRLSDSGLDVLLLESGGLGLEEATQALYAGHANHAAVKLETCRQRWLGGSTNRWAGWCRPLEREDFEARDWIERSGWPLSADDMAPHYARAHETVQIGAVDYDTDSLAQGAPGPVLPTDPERVRCFFYQYSPPTRFGTLYRDALVAADRVRCVLHTNVVEVVLEDDGHAVRELRCATLDGRGLVARARRFVLAMGGIETPRLLLASDAQEPSGVGNANDLVGRFFMEHPHYYTCGFILAEGPLDTSLYLGKQDTTSYDVDHPGGLPARVRGSLGLPAAVRAREGLIGMAATLLAQDPDDAGVFDGPVTPARAAAVVRGGGEWSLLKLTMRAEQRPVSESRVTLADDRDALGMRRVDVQWKVAPRDLVDVRRTADHLGAELARSGVGRLWVPLDGGGGFEPLGTSGGCHHMGTARMAESAAAGVVDGDCLVHGLDNLYLAGSAVFPTGGFANPTLTIVALAHRLADHLEGLA